MAEAGAESSRTEEQPVAEAAAAEADTESIIEGQPIAGVQAASESHLTGERSADAVEATAKSVTEEQPIAGIEVASEPPLPGGLSADAIETDAEWPVVEEQSAASIGAASESLTESQPPVDIEVAAESPLPGGLSADAIETDAEWPVVEEQSAASIGAASESLTESQPPVDIEVAAESPLPGGLSADAIETDAEWPVVEEQSAASIGAASESLTEGQPPVPGGVSADAMEMNAEWPVVEEQSAASIGAASESLTESQPPVPGGLSVDAMETDTEAAERGVEIADRQSPELRVLGGAVATLPAAGARTAAMGRPQPRGGGGQLTSLLAFAENSDPYLVISTRNYPPPPTNLAHPASLAIPRLTTPLCVPKPAPPTPPAAPPPPERSRLSNWVLVAAGAVSLAIASSIYHVAAAPDTSVPHAAARAPKQVRLPEPDPDAEYPFARFVEVAGLRVVDQNDRPQAQYLVVNHSSTQLNDIGLRIAVRSATGAEGAKPLFTLSARVPTLGPHESKEIRTDLDSSIRSGQIPDWVNLRTDVKIFSPQ